MIKRYSYCLITATITISILTCLYFTSNAYENTFFLSDAYDQYSALMAQFQNILSGADSLFYSFKGGLGHPFLGTFFYYLASPFNLLLLFIKDINTFLIIITLLKLTIASITAHIFFEYHFKNDKKIYTILFSITYVFLAYNMRYFFNIMWLDAVYLLPLLLLGIDKIVKHKKKLLFPVSLVMFIATNYYMGYMACIFSMIYFNYRTISKQNTNIIKENLLFIIQLSICLLLSAFVLIPVITYIPNYARSLSMSEIGLQFNWNILDFFKSFLIGSASQTGLLNPESFHLYMGIFTLPLICFYFINNAFSKKERLLTLGIIIILFISTACNYVNYMWHGFAPPQFFNGRFTFFFSLFLLFTSYKSLTHIKNITIKSYAITFIALGILFCLITKGNMLYINLFFLFTTLFCLLFLDYQKLFMTTALSIFIMVEIVINSTNAISTFQFAENKEIKKDRETYLPAIQYIKKHNYDRFYRIETDGTKPYNSPIMYDYYGIDLFLSTIYENSAEFFIDIGYGSGDTKINTISYYSGREVMDSFLGIKYHIETNATFINDNYLLLTNYSTHKNNVSVYENPYALPLGYMVSNHILSVEKTDNALTYQNSIFKAIVNQDINIFEPIELTRINIDEYSFINVKQDPIHIFTKIDLSHSYTNFQIYVKNQKAVKIRDHDIVEIVNDYLLEEELTVQYYNLDIDNFSGIDAAYYSHDNFVNIIGELKDNPLNIEVFRNSYIKGNITATEKKNILLLTLPYEENWHIYVDGKEVRPLKVLDDLIGVELEPGLHTVELKYKPREFYIGIFISCMTFILIILFKIKKSILKAN